MLNICYVVIGLLFLIIIVLVVKIILPIRRLWRALNPIDFASNSIDLTKLDELKVTGIGTLAKIEVRCKEFVDAICKRVDKVNDIQEVSEKDELTGCFNRTKLTSMLPLYEGSKVYTVLFIDVNNLKRMNDTFGHEAGDTLLRSASRKLRFWDVYGDVYRVGGDEFMIVLKDRTLESTRQILKQWYPTVGVLNRSSDGFRCVLSYGLAQGIEGVSFEEVEKLADKRMYTMKEKLKKNFGEPMR